MHASCDPAQGKVASRNLALGTDPNKSPYKPNFNNTKNRNNQFEPVSGSNVCLSLSSTAISYLI